MALRSYLKLHSYIPVKSLLGASRSGCARFPHLLLLAAEESAPDQHVQSNRLSPEGPSTTGATRYQCPPADLGCPTCEH